MSKNNLEDDIHFCFVLRDCHDVFVEGAVTLTIIKGPCTPPRTSSRGGRNPSPIDEQGRDEVGAEVESIVSIPASILFLTVHELEQTEGLAAPVWMTSVEDSQVPLDWTPVAREERAAIEHICKMIDQH